MGDPKKPRKKFESPPIEWDSERIKEEKGLMEEYGLKNVREVWKAKARLRKIRGNARRLLAVGESGEGEAKQILDRVRRYGILKAAEDRENTLDDLLALDVRSILDRRLQTRVYKKGLARSIKQARQLITHGFISINGNKITVPSYIVPLSEDDSIEYYRKIDIAPKLAVSEPAQGEAENKEEGEMNG